MPLLTQVLEVANTTVESVIEESPEDLNDDDAGAGASGQSFGLHIDGVVDGSVASSIGNESFVSATAVFMEVFDANGDGVISLDEFQQMIQLITIVR